MDTGNYSLCGSTTINNCFDTWGIQAMDYFKYYKQIFLFLFIASLLSIPSMVFNIHYMIQKDDF